MLKLSLVLVALIGIACSVEQGVEESISVSEISSPVARYSFCINESDWSEEEVLTILEAAASWNEVAARNNVPAVIHYEGACKSSAPISRDTFFDGVCAVYRYQKGGEIDALVQKEASYSVIGFHSKCDIGIRSDVSSKLQVTVAHEFGHAIGLEHGEKGTLMYYKGGPAEPTEGDEKSLFPERES
jgi:hypothetical protein